MMNFEKIKLIIWDLDDTLWEGTLSEGDINFPQKHAVLLKMLMDCGIINSICSKNDYEKTIDCLKKLGIEECFVFMSIDWTSKGQRISTMLKDMGLRADNVLFIDDNITNLQDALFREKNLMVSSPDIIPQLEDYVKSLPKNDPDHKRLKQYRMLESKRELKKSFGKDNEAFLYSTNTRVEIHKDCISQADRIHELILRTNQLNFTKIRCTKEELILLLNDSRVDSAYIKASDKFGDYGIVGFYAIKEGVLLHFLFSCRTIGQGVEQYVYSLIGWPELNIVGDVVSHLERIPAPKWINQNNRTDTINKKKIKGKVLLKGPCDISGMLNFLDSDSIISELTHIGKTRHNYIEHHNHSVNFLQFNGMLDEEKQDWLALPMNDEDMFDTALFDRDLNVVFLSSVLEPALGIYKNRITGRMFAYGGLWDKPLTDKKYWDAYVNNEVFTGDNKYTYDFLERFSAKYEFVGRQSPTEYVENLRKLLQVLPSHTFLCILLGSEIPHLENKHSFLVERHIINKQYNDAIKHLASSEPRVGVIDFTAFVKDQSDYADRITHFSRRVYFEAAIEANRIIEEKTGRNYMKSRFLLFFETLFKTTKTYMYSVVKKIMNCCSR